MHKYNKKPSFFTLATFQVKVYLISYTIIKGRRKKGWVKTRKLNGIMFLSSSNGSFFLQLFTMGSSAHFFFFYVSSWLNVLPRDVLEAKPDEIGKLNLFFYCPHFSRRNIIFDLVNKKNKELNFSGESFHAPILMG